MLCVPQTTFDVVKTTRLSVAVSAADMTSNPTPGIASGLILAVIGVYLLELA